MKQRKYSVVFTIDDDSVFYFFYISGADPGGGAPGARAPKKRIGVTGLDIKT